MAKARTFTDEEIEELETKGGARTFTDEEVEAYAAQSIGPETALPQVTRTDKYTGGKVTMDRDRLELPPSLGRRALNFGRDVVDDVQRNPVKTAVGLTAPLTAPSGLIIPLMGTAAAADEAFQNFTGQQDTPSLVGQVGDIGLSMGMAGLTNPATFGVRPFARVPRLLPEGDASLAGATREVTEQLRTAPTPQGFPQERPDLRIRREGEGQAEAVRAGAERAGVTTTPMQEGSKAGQAIETFIDANPVSQAMNQGKVERMRDASYQSGKRLFDGAGDIAKTGRKVKETLNRAQQTAKQEYEDAFSATNAAAMDDPLINRAAGNDIAVSVGDIRKQMNLRPDLVEDRLVPLETETLRMLDRVEAIAGRGRNFDPVLGGKASPLDYQALNSIRQAIGKRMERFDGEKGMSQDLAVLGRLYHTIEEAQTKFLTPDGIGKWRATKDSFSQFAEDRKMLQPIITGQTLDSNVVNSLVKDGGPESLKAVLRYAERTGEKGIVDEIRGAYLQELVDNTTTLKAFDRNLKRLGDTQREYFADETTQRARDLVAFNQSIETLATQQDKASRMALSMIGGTLGLGGLGALAGGGAGAAIGVAGYLVSGIVTKPLYTAVVAAMRNVRTPELREALGRIVRTYAVNSAEGVNALPAPDLNMQGYATEAR